MKATTTTPAMEAPTICCCCSMKTFSIIVGLSTVLGSICMKPFNEIFYGKIAIVMCIFEIIKGMNFFAVGFTDNPKFSKSAQILMYVTVLMIAAEACYLIWDLNNESSTVVEIQFEFAKQLTGLFGNANIEMSSEMEEGYRNVIKQCIFRNVFTIFIQLYIAGKYGENADYLGKKKQEEAKVHIEF